MYGFMVFSEAVARTPRHWGLNIEMQDYHDEVNLWDWLADSGATIVRELHPPSCLRKDTIAADAWDHIASRGDLEAFRTKVKADPEGSLIQWDAYMFGESVPWIGVPDGIMRKVSEIGVLPLVSMDYPTTAFARPLVKDLELDGIPEDDGIDWSAAASAYDYHFAFMYHFAREFGSRYFLMHNEPECSLDKFHLPKDLTEGEDHPFLTLEGRKRSMACLSTQWGVIAMLARMALDDVREIVGEEEGPYFLAGPVNGAWEQFWEKGGQYMDSLDYHHYHPNPVAFKTVHDRVAARAAEKGKRISCSEYNVKPGLVPFTEILFDHTAAIVQARFLMEAMRLSSADEPVYDFLTLYEFSFPTPERNHKALLYGDMNCLDWSTFGRQMQHRPEEWYPTFEEQQMRHATPAYHVFRMLSRCVPGSDGNPDGHAILRSGSECLIDDAHGGAESQLVLTAIDAGDKVLINVLNPGNCPLTVPINLGSLGNRFRFAVVRMLAKLQYDEAIDQVELGSTGSLEVDVPSMGLAQVILTPLDLDKATSVRVEETTTTPGTADSLSFLQTTRLRAIATIDGTDVDVTCLNTVWTSSDPWLVPVYQGGLVQRTRHSERDTTITARLLSGPEAEVLVRGQ